jgi:hypothetical protein
LEGFVCLEEYRMDELCEVFDHFMVQPVVRQKCYIRKWLDAFILKCWWSAV